MADITWLGDSYQNVPYVQLPQTGGGTVQFTEISDTTATAADVASGKKFYLANGSATTGSIASKSASDLTVSGATVTAPAGLYATNASKSVASGSVTAPSTISGTSATASSSSTTITLTKTVSVTPNVTTAGYISSGTAGNASVSLSATDSNFDAENIKSGVSLFGKTGTYTGGGGSSKNVQVAAGVNRVAATSYTAVSGQSITVAETGTYDVYWSGYRSSTSGTNGSQLYIGSTAYGSAQTSFTNNGQSVHLTSVSLTKDQVVTVRARSRSTSYYMYVSNLTIVQN